MEKKKQMEINGDCGMGINERMNMRDVGQWELAR